MLSPKGRQGEWAPNAIALALLPLQPLFNILATFRLYLFTVIATAIDVLSGSTRRRKANAFLQDNYAPIDREIHVQNLPVQGNLPAALNGVFARTGPNPYFSEFSGDYHWFDGDGMLHACRIKDGNVTYSNRYIKTFRLAQEKAAGRPIHLKLGDMRGFGGMLHLQLMRLKALMGFAVSQHGSGTANTALVYHANKLMSLHEGDLPYAVRVLCSGVIESLGRVEFDGKVNHPFTAHPKADAATGELFFIGYEVDPSNPRVNYAALSAAGELMFDHCIPMEHAVMHHDFAVTQDHALLLDHCLEFNGEVMVKEGALPFSMNYKRNARIGVIPKRLQGVASKDVKVRWFELDQPLAIFHTVNAWQEGDSIHLFACIYDKMDLSDLKAGSIPEVAEIRLNMQTGQTSLTLVQPGLHVDFPRVRQDLLGYSSRYAYCPVMGDFGQGPKFKGIAKLDLHAPAGKTLVAELSFGKLRGGEAFFVPASPDLTQLRGEDDGYLMTFIHDEQAISLGSSGSFLVVYDAWTMADEPVARVPIPQRVPYGFHCHHMNEDEFQQHLQLSRDVQESFAQPA